MISHFFLVLFLVRGGVNKTTVLFYLEGVGKTRVLFYLEGVGKTRFLFYLDGGLEKLGFYYI